MYHCCRLSLVFVLLLTGCQTALSPDSESGNTFAAVKVAAQQGDAHAQLQLAAHYSRGEGVAKSYTQAAQWLDKAAQQNNAAAQGILATMYYEGVGVPQNYLLAAHWAERAADAGDSVGQSLLGQMYAEGRGFTQSDSLAYVWFSLAAVTGDKLDIANRDRVASKLSPAALREAQLRALTMAQAIAAKKLASPP